MAQVFLDRLHIVAALQGHNGVGVPLRYNYDKPEESRNIKGFQGFKPDFLSFSNPKIKPRKLSNRRGCYINDK